MDEKPMKRNEPTTGEIIELLREFGDVYFGETEIDNDMIADRLERQEQTIAELGDLIEKCNERLINQDGLYGVQIAALTARAEQAEAERDAAIADMEGYCQFCAWYECEETDPPCNTCFNTRTFESDDINRAKNWKYRGIRDGKERV